MLSRVALNRGKPGTCFLCGIEFELDDNCLDCILCVLYLVVILTVLQVYHNSRCSGPEGVGAGFVCLQPGHGERSGQLSPAHEAH